MFTGIVEEVGTVQEIRKNETWCVLKIAAGKILEGVEIGDSIAVNGVCLTVSAKQPNQFIADVMPETFAMTNLNLLTQGDKVNLERAMSTGGRFGGHIVSGHVDGTGKITSRKTIGNAVLYTVEASAALLYYMIPKGSITIDGISLTIVALTSSSFSVSIIPHTSGATTLQAKRLGEIVNLECDMVGKYVEKFINTRKPVERITTSFLADHGFM